MLRNLPLSGQAMFSPFALLFALAEAPTKQPDIRDIEPPIDVFPYPAWQVALAALLLLSVVATGIVLYRHWLATRSGPPPPSPRSVAIRALQGLRGRAAAEEPYAFSIAVSDVLRQFIDAQYGLRAGRQTSREFLGSVMIDKHFTAEDHELLTTFLEQVDLIKFARSTDDPAVNAQLLDAASAFVQGGRA